MANEIKYTTITWEEYTRLQRRSHILEWIDADFARNGVGIKYSEAVGEMLDTGLDMRQTLDRFARSLKPRRRQRPSEGEATPQPEAAPNRL